MESRIKIFYSYAHEDEKLRDELEKHLSNLERLGQIEPWYDRKIVGGREWAHEIVTNIKDAQIILLLISPDFMASRYCHEVELPLAMERYEARQARVIPVILRPVDWKGAAFERFQVLPTDGKAITSWSNQDEAFLEVAKGIRRVVEELSPDAKLSTDSSGAVAGQKKISASLQIWNLPFPRNPLFTGREDILKHLHDTLSSDKAVALTQARQSAQPQAISGLGGIGKTQTAVEYAYRYQGDYKAVLWAKADARETLVSDFVTLAAILNLPEKDAQDQSLAVAAVKRWLQTNRGWLLILDNADDLAMVREFIPPAVKGHILLTTRAEATGRLAQRVEVEKMELEEGALFLLRRAGIIAQDDPIDKASVRDRAKAKEISQVLDGLPLALDQAGAYIDETACGLAGYLNLYRTRRAQLLKRRGGLVADHPESVATTWSLSFEKVEKANPAAADLLRLCAFLHPDAIAEEIVTEGADDLGPVLQPVAADPFELNAAIEELRKFSLLRRDPEAKTLTIHRLVQEVLKDRMDEETQRQWAERTVRAVNVAFPSPPEFTMWFQCQRCLPHAQTCRSLIDQWSMEFAEAARLLNTAGYYLKGRAQYAEAEPLYQRAIVIYEKVLGPEDANVATCLSNLANVYREQGKYAEAEPFYQRAIEIGEKTLGSEHPDMATKLNNLALLYSDQGKYAEAEPLYQRALAIGEKTLGPEDPLVATYTNNLANLYRDQGKYAEAESLYQRALAIDEKALGSDHPDLAIDFNNLASLYVVQGKYAEAELLYQRAIAIGEKTLGPGHPQLALYLENYAYLLRKTNRQAEAAQLEARARAIRARHAQENPTS